MGIDKKRLVENKFFESFTYDEIDEIILMSKTKSLQTGEEIIFQGDYDQDEYFFYFVIIEGSVNVIVYNTLINSLGTGECFGEVAYLTSGERSAKIVAREDNTEVLQIDGKAVDEQGTQELRYKLMQRIAKALAERLSKSNEIATLQIDPADQLPPPPPPLQPPPPPLEPVKTEASPLASILTPQEQEKIYRDNSAKVKLMEASDFFKDFSRLEILEILSFRNAFIKYPGNKKIVTQGDKDRSFFVIIKGYANVVKGTMLLKKLERGDSFGEMSILDGSPRVADVIAGDDCCTIRVDAIVLEKASLPLQLKFHKKFSRILSHRLEMAIK